MKPALPRLLVIDNLAVESSRRVLYRAIAAAAVFEVHLLVPPRWRETTFEVPCEEEPTYLLHLHRTPVWFGNRPHRVLYSRLFRIVRRIRPDVVLAVHAPENYATLQLLLARRLLHPRMKIALFASRNLDLPAVGFPYKLAFLNHLCDAAVARSKVDVVFHRPAGFGGLYSRYAAHAVYVPHWVDCTTFKRSRAPTDWRAGLVNLGYVGRLTAEKGVHLLLEACARMPQHVRLSILGSGPDLKALEKRVVSLGLRDRVRIVAPVRHDEIPQFMKGIDILVLPSLGTKYWKELFGRVLIEAMACEVPVAASDSGGIPEVLGDGGVLFAAGDVQDMVEKLNQLVVDAEARKLLGARGRERAVRLFDAPVVAGMLRSELEQLYPQAPTGGVPASEEVSPAL